MEIDENKHPFQHHQSAPGHVLLLSSASKHVLDGFSPIGFLGRNLFNKGEPGSLILEGGKGKGGLWQ